MRKLHLVGVTSDQKGLIFSGRRGSKSGGYVVPIEDELIDAIADAHRTINGEEPAQLAAALDHGDAPRRPRPESTLTPREMQARLRAGRSIVEVAAEARVGTEWVERFAIPILAEQAKMVALARTLSYSKPRLGESSAPLDQSVLQNLADRGVRLPDDVFDAAWSAYQLHDTVWVVRFRYQSRGRLQEAAWELDTEAGTLTSRNRLASELGYAEKTRRRRSRDRSAGVEPDGEMELPTPRPPAKPTTRARPRPTRKATARPTRKATARPATKATARPAAKATARPAAKARARPATKPSTKATTKAAKKTTTKATSRPAPTASTTSTAKAPTKRSSTPAAGSGASRRPARSSRRTTKKTSTAPPRSSKSAAAPHPEPEAARPGARRSGSRARAKAVSVPPAPARAISQVAPATPPPPPAAATPPPPPAPAPAPAAAPSAAATPPARRMPAESSPSPSPAPVEVEFELEEPPAARERLQAIADDADSIRPGQASDRRAVIAAPPASEVARNDLDAPDEDAPTPQRRVRRSLRFGPAPAG